MFRRFTDKLPSGVNVKKTPTSRGGNKTGGTVRGAGEMGGKLGMGVGMVEEGESTTVSSIV